MRVLGRRPAGPADCKSHTWDVLDEANHEIVESHDICPQIFLPVHLKIKAGKSFSESRDVVLTGAKYSDGRTYTLRYFYWGYTQSTNFTAKVVH